MRLLRFILPLATVQLLEAKILDFSEIDASCGTGSGSNAAYLRNTVAPEIESLMGVGIKALSTTFSSLPANQQAFQQLLFGTGDDLDLSRQTALQFLSAALSKSQRISDSMPLYIQCGERSLRGVDLATSKLPNGEPGPPVLYNFLNKFKISSTKLTICTGGTAAYTSGSVIVLCPVIWQPQSTKGSSRPISTQTLSEIISSNRLLGRRDHVDRIEDITGFSLLHEWMHWSTGTTTGTNPVIDDKNGYTWEQMIEGSGSSPELTAQTYSYLCYGTMLMQSGYNWGSDGIITATPPAS
ncbi:hypothetical protein F5884DRAFT_857183 [Xylogone sp. PMI_703]|nr:hypothetical protein F5884DRAFT_857183 [Xylogone sp. PMI_703]